MYTIYKYPLTIGKQSQVLELPEYAEILYIDYQHGLLQLWAKINTEAPLKPRIINRYGTGFDISERPLNENYINTIFIERGTFVFHFFEDLS
jgi:hypothetical protein